MCQEWDCFKLHSRQGEFINTAYFIHKVFYIIILKLKELQYKSESEIQNKCQKIKINRGAQDLSTRWILMNAHDSFKGREERKSFK